MSYEQFETYEKNLHKRRGSEPARAYLWAVELPDLTVDPSNGSKSESFSKASSDLKSRFLPVDMQLVNTLVTSITTPFFTFDTDKVTSGSTFWYKATHNDISNISMTLEEQENGVVWNYINNWKNLMLASNGGQNPPAFYKRDITFLRLDLMKMQFQKFVYSNYFISEVSQITNDYTSNAAVQYNLTFTGDSLLPVYTLEGAALEARLERASQLLGGVEIPYDPFAYSGVPAPAISNLLGTIASRALT